MALAVVGTQAECAARIVAQGLILHKAVRHIQPEAIHTHLQPVTDNLHHCRAQFRVTPVEIRLFLEERVQIVLACAFIPLPRRAAEDRLPVVWRREMSTAPWLAVAPEIPVAL